MNFEDFKHNVISVIKTESLKLELYSEKDNIYFFKNEFGTFFIEIKFEELHLSNQQQSEATTQSEAMKNFGHNNAQTTKGYFNLNSTDVKMKEKNEF